MSRYLVAAAATAAAVLLRWIADPWLGEYLLFTPLFGALAVAVWYGGYRPALVAVVLGLLAYVYLFMEPRGSFYIHHVSDVVAVLLYLFTCAIIIGFGEGISERKRQARELEASQKMLTGLIAQCPYGIYIVDADFRITTMNTGSQRGAFVNVRPVIGRPFDEALHILWPEAVAREISERFRHTLATGEPYYSQDFVKLRADIEETEGYEWELHRLTLPNGRHGVVCYYYDSTKLRQAAQLTRLVVNNVIDAIITIDERGIIESYNPAAEKIFGYTAGEMIGRTINALMPEPYQSEHDGYISRYLQTGQARIIGIGREVVGRRRDGSIFSMDLAVSEFWVGQTRHFTGIGRDITERREAEEALRRSEAQLRERHVELQEADRRKDEFLAMLAHELRGPLAPLRNMLEIMKQAADDGDLLRQARDTMDRQLGQLVRLVDDLLDVSRITRNRLALRRERVELAAVVGQAVEACRPLADCANHELHVELPQQPIYLHADAVRLTQVLSNLLNNACKYTPPGGQVWLTGERQGSDVAVSVKDNGVGIPADKLDSIFGMFMQVDRALEWSQGGLGIGLTLVRRLVEMHGGTVEAHSAGEGKGSEFRVRLPILIEQPQPVAVELAARPPAARRRILVVDDNRDSAASLAMLLEIAGNEIHTAHDGLEALEAAEKFLPEVVLLDIGLPKLSGHEVCRSIRQQPWGKEMMLVALTGWGQDEDRRKSQEAGFNHHMVKPIEYAELAKLLAELQPA